MGGFNRMRLLGSGLSRLIRTSTGFFSRRTDLALQVFARCISIVCVLGPRHLATGTLPSIPPLPTAHGDAPMSHPDVSTSTPAAPDSPGAVDMDHHKERRNRTTQSCLNCHTQQAQVRPQAAL